MRKPAPLGKLFRRRRCIVPTFRGAVLLLLLLAAVVAILVRWSVDFLALTRPLPGGVLVVEGWAPDHVIVEAVAEFRRNPYAKLIVTGGPIDKGLFYSEHRTYAELGAATIRQLDQSLPVEAVPAPFARRDRTYASVLALKQWSTERGVPLPAMNVVSLGVHSRRTWSLYRKVFGKNARIGSISVPEQTFDPQAWWRSSAGVRTVVGEMIAYSYVRLLFFAEE